MEKTRTEKTVRLVIKAMAYKSTLIQVYGINNKKLTMQMRQRLDF